MPPEPKTLRPYQEQSLRILARCPHGLDASDMGAGKTLVGVERLRRIKAKDIPRVLVIAPINTHSQWLSTLAGQYPSLAGTPYLRVLGSPAKDPEAWKLLTTHQPGVYIISWEAMRGSLVTAEARAVKRLKDELLAAWSRWLDPVSPDELAMILTKYKNELHADKALAAIKDHAERLHLPPSQEIAEAAQRLHNFEAELSAAPKRRNKTVEDRPTQAKVREAIKWGLIPPWTRTGTWDLVIADEVHRVCNPRSLTSVGIKMIKSTHRHGASGTPSGNRVEGLWGVAHWLWPQQFTSFWSWAEEYLELEERTINNAGDTRRIIVGEKFPGSTFASLPCVVRHRTQDVIDQMPTVVEREVVVAMASEQARIYEEMESQAFAWLASAPLTAQLPIEQNLRLRQAALGEIDWLQTKDGEEEVGFNPKAANPKIDALREIISDLPEKEPVLVFTHSGKFARLVVARLGTRARLWSGDVTTKRREALKDGFLAGEFQVLVAQTEAMAEGVDGLQRVCRCEVWLSESSSMIMNQQARRRLNRPGQKSSQIHRWYIRSGNTIDEKVRSRLLRAEDQMATLYGDAAPPTKSP